MYVCMCICTYLYCRTHLVEVMPPARLNARRLLAFHDKLPLCISIYLSIYLHIYMCTDVYV